MEIELGGPGDIPSLPWLPEGGDREAPEAPLVDTESVLEQEQKVPCGHLGEGLNWTGNRGQRSLTTSP